MPTYTYPVAPPTGTLTAAQIHLLLSQPNVIARRVAEIAKMRFVADFLLSNPYVAKGGGIFYETGEEIFAADAAVESITPGGAYPKTVLTQGEIAGAKTDKRGLGTDITDEKISREGMVYVNKGLQRLANSVIKDVDSIALAIILSKVTSTFASPAAWTTAGALAEALLSISGTRADLGTGLSLDTVLLKPAKFAKVVGMLINDKALPREAGNIIVTGSVPFDALGFTWVTSPFYTSDNPLLVDRAQLGGMADENLESPEFRRAGDSKVEVASDRKKGVDAYELRARRVTVPVVTDPLAGVTITSAGL